MFNMKYIYIYTPYSCKDSECSHVAGGDEASVATDPRKPLDSSPGIAIFNSRSFWSIIPSGKLT